MNFLLGTKSSVTPCYVNIDHMTNTTTCSPYKEASGHSIVGCQSLEKRVFDLV